MKVLLERFHSNGYAIGFHPQAHNLELRTKQTVPCAFIRNLVACSIYEPLPVTVNHIERSVFELSRTTGDMSSIHSRRHSTKSNKQKIFEKNQKNFQFEKNQMFSLNVSDHVRMFYFRTSSIEIPRSSNEVELITEKHEWNKIVRWSSVETPKAI